MTPRMRCKTILIKFVCKFVNHILSVICKILKWAHQLSVSHLTYYFVGLYTNLFWQSLSTIRVHCLFSLSWVSVDLFWATFKEHFIKTVSFDLKKSGNFEFESYSYGHALNEQKFTHLASSTLDLLKLRCWGVHRQSQCMTHKTTDVTTVTTNGIAK